MNGNSIYLVSSDNGTGVKNDGIIYGADNVELTSNGDIINNYAIVSDKNVSLSAQKNVINRKRINANDSININALKFLDKVAGSDQGWQETVNADGIITRVSPDGSVTATLKMPTETQANPIVEFRGSGTEVKYLPYCSDQTVKFI